MNIAAFRRDELDTAEAKLVQADSRPGNTQDGGDRYANRHSPVAAVLHHEGWGSGPLSDQLLAQPGDGGTAPAVLHSALSIARIDETILWMLNGGGGTARRSWRKTLRVLRRDSRAISMDFSTPWNPRFWEPWRLANAVVRPV